MTEKSPLELAAFNHACLIDGVNPKRANPYEFSVVAEDCGIAFKAGAEWLARAILNTDESLSGYNARDNLEKVITQLTRITDTEAK